MNFKQLINAHKRILNEIYNVEPGDSLRMELDYFGLDNGLEKFELDGVEFYKGIDEDLNNAIESCIDEKFMPEWQKSGVNYYIIENINYNKNSETGYVTVQV